MSVYSRIHLRSVDREALCESTSDKESDGSKDGPHDGLVECEGKIEP